MRRILPVLLCLALSGCDYLEEATLTPVEKVARAFPPAVPVQAADERLHALLANDPAALQELDALLAQRYELRALSCAQHLVIGRSDSVQAVQGMLVDRDCLREQDAQLQHYLQSRLIALRLAQPALRPLQPLGSSALAAPGFKTSNATVAAAANVGVLIGTRSELASVELPGGQLISSLHPVSRPNNSGMLSANGRVLGVNLFGNQGLSLLDAELGDEVMHLPQLREVLAWLPAQQAALVSSINDNRVMIFDFLSGEMTPVADIPDAASWALPLVPAGTSFLIGTSRQYNFVDCQRQAEGMHCESTRVLKPSSSRVMASGRSLLLDNGRTLLFAHRDSLLLLDLQTGTERTLWDKRLFTGSWARLSETQVLLDALGNNALSTSTWVLDIEKETLAPVLDQNPNMGLIIGLAGRNGFIRRGFRSLRAGDQFRLGAPVALADYVAQRVQEREEALRQRAESPSREEHIRRLMASEQQRLERATSSGARVTPPAPPTVAGRLVPPPPPVQRQLSFREPSAGTQGQTLADYASGARIAAVGVYQSSKAQSQSGQRRPGEIRLDVAPSSRPLVLVLSSYEPVVWKINRQPGTQISLILLSSHHPSQVVGADDTPVQLMSARLAYKQGSEGYQQLNREVQRLTGKGIDSFQGSYQSEQFSIGGR